MKFDPVTEFSAERCEILARVIEQQPHTKVTDADGFNMNSVRHDCGSPCCIEGFASSMLTERYGTYAAIQNFTGCTAIEAGILYHGFFARSDTGEYKHLETVTPAEAAAALRALAAKRQEFPAKRCEILARVIERQPLFPAETAEAFRALAAERQEQRQ
jgi:hypothetical protein